VTCKTQVCLSSIKGKVVGFFLKGLERKQELHLLKDFHGYFHFWINISVTIFCFSDSKHSVGVLEANTLQGAS
jgi:hypothetical protein